MKIARTLLVPSLLGGLLGLAACSSSNDGSSKGSADDGGSTVPCATRGDECKASQMTCVSDGTTETCQACPVGEYAETAGHCAKIPGSVLHHDFGTYTLEPAQEIDGLCQSWTVGNEAEIWVNAVELVNEGGYHHSNWLFVPEDKYPGADGAWKCSERGYSELDAAIAGGVLFAQSTQSHKEVQKFPAGVAVHLPPHVKIIGGTHMQNTSPDPVTTTLQMSVFAVDRADVRVPLAPFRLSYLDLHIQPQAVSDFTGSCDFSAAVPGGTPGDLDMELYYVLPHYHSLGHSFELQKVGGPDDGKVLYDLGSFDSEAHGRAFDPPIDMHGSSGFQFTCGFDNPRAVEVKWGIGDQEMCVMLGFARSDYAFDAAVATGVPLGQENGEYRYSGECGVAPLEFARGRGGL